MGKSHTHSSISDAAAIFILSALVLLSPSLSSAETLENYTINFHMAYGKVVVDKEMLFSEKATNEIFLDVPDDVKTASLYIDNAFVESKVEDGRIRARLNSSKSIRLNYVTGEFVDRSEFIVSMRMPYDADNLKVTLTLPENSVLENPLPKSDISTSQAYPLPDAVTTDGLLINLAWGYSGLKKGDEKSFFVRFIEKKGNSYLIWALGIIIIALIALVAFLFKRKPSVERVVEKVVEKEDMLEKHLKEDEEQVVNILKQREGQCEQGTLRVITGFSKAKLSGLLKELEERNVVHKEKRGKKNLVFLKKL